MALRAVHFVLALAAMSAHAQSTDPVLRPCPGTPNCVSSTSVEQSRHVDPLRLAAEPQVVWGALAEVLSSRPRAVIVSRTDTRLQATERSRLFGFVDDIEFVLDAADQTVHVRSASRTGYWDLGVNRRRVEDIREALAARGLVDR